MPDDTIPKYLGQEEAACMHVFSMDDIKSVIAPWTLLDRNAIWSHITGVIKTWNGLDWTRSKIVITECHSQSTLCPSRCKINSSIHLLLSTWWYIYNFMLMLACVPPVKVVLKREIWQIWKDQYWSLQWKLGPYEHFMRHANHNVNQDNLNSY